ncbi:hypothetical protein FAF44_02375 [Nonomuraea sp. MG754425]|uniref:hypothetical protein n=1 Tax=Nonomuraea sp. MG754425 TaxID=2570319 RepID=UPI001F20D406|nr:hypothetical protein [Nonomuraea sp. MG754425]MCF6467258.1 hypothetical protein [Nonomuraea sp. MG754425]
MVAGRSEVDSQLPGILSPSSSGGISTTDVEPAWQTEALPEWAVNWLIPMLTAGEPWPRASESGLWQVRLAFEDATGVLVSSLEPTAFSIRDISAGLESPAKPAAFARTRQLFDEQTGVLAKAGSTALYALQMDHMARQTQYSKLSINVAFWVSLTAALIAILVVTAGPLARLLVGAVARSGNVRMALALERLAMLAGRPYATSALSRLPGLSGGVAGGATSGHLLTLELYEEVAEEVFGDALAQFQQIRMGTLDEWDWSKTRAAAIGATIGTVVGVMIANQTRKVADSIPGIEWLNARAGDAPGVVNAILRFPGRALNTGLNNVAASPVGSVVANGVVYGQWTPPTSDSLLGAFMGGVGRTNTISPFSAEVATAVLHPVSTLAGVLDGALATVPTGPSFQQETGQHATAETSHGSGAATSVRASLDLADPAHPQTHTPSQTRAQTQSSARPDESSTAVEPDSPGTPRPRQPGGSDRPAGAAPQGPSADHAPADPGTSAEPGTPAEPPSGDGAPRHDTETVPPPDVPEAVSPSTPDSDIDTGTTTTSSTTTSSAVAGQEVRDAQPAGAAEPSKRSIEALINRSPGPTEPGSRSDYTLVAARPIEGTRFVAGGRHRTLPKLTVEEVRATLDAQVLPADFGTTVKGWRWSDTNTLIVETGDGVQHFRFEIGDVRGNLLGRTQVGPGTATDPHHVQLTPRVARDQVARLVVHELTDTFQRLAAPRSGVLRPSSSEPAGRDHCVTARHSEFRLLSRKLAAAATDAERAILRSEIDGILGELSRYGRPLPDGLDGVPTGEQGSGEASPDVERPLSHQERMQAVATRWRSILEEKLAQGNGSTFSRKQLKSIQAEVAEIEADYLEGGVDFSLIQIQEILDALDSAEPAIVVIEGFGPYLVDYGGAITGENMIPADSRGLRLMAAITTSMRGRAPSADVRVGSLWDEYNDTSEHHPDGRADLEFTPEMIAEFRASIVDRLKDSGAIPADAREGVDFHLFQESTLTERANELVGLLETAGLIQRNGDRIHLVNPEFTNPLFHKFGLRTPNKWLCVALDTAQLGALVDEVRTEGQESPRIIKIVALPHYMKEEQSQLRELLNVLGGKLNIEYHNIFYDPAGDLVAMAEVIERKLGIRVARPAEGATGLQPAPPGSGDPPGDGR